MKYFIGLFSFIKMKWVIWMDSHFNGYKVKYEILNKYMAPICNSQIVKSINIFINLDDLFHLMHNPLINSEFQICGRDAPKQLISNIFNLLGHYRYWAIKNRYACKIFGIYTTSYRSFKNNIYIPNYRDRFKVINAPENASCYFVNNALNDAFPMLQIISKYIPDVYLIDSKYIEPSVIPLYISEEIEKSDWNILISRDTYDLQYSYRNRWNLVTPKGEYSRVVNQDGIWDYVNFKEKVFKDDTKVLNYPYGLYILSKAVVGDKYRSIPKLRKIGWKTLFKYLDQVVDENSSVSETTLKIKLIEKIKGRSSLSNDTINNNLNTINIDLQKEAMLEIDKTLIMSQIIDVPDYENLQELNRIQFMKYPINLQFLCNTGVINKNKSPFD